MVNNPLAMQKTQVRSLDQEDPLDKGIATHSRVLSWKIPWTEEPGRLQLLGRTELDTTEPTNIPSCLKVFSKAERLAVKAESSAYWDARVTREGQQPFCLTSLTCFLFVHPGTLSHSWRVFDLYAYGSLNHPQPCLSWWWPLEGTVYIASPRSFHSFCSCC